MITGGGHVRNGNWNALLVDEVNALAEAAKPMVVPPDAVRPITKHWEALQDSVLGALRRRRGDVFNGLSRTFEARANDDARAVKRILNELKAY